MTPNEATTGTPSETNEPDLLEEMRALPDDYDELIEAAEEKASAEAWARKFFGGY